MPRKQLIRTDQLPYHVTTRSNNRDWFSIPMPEVWEIGMKSLAYAHSRTEVKLHAFVLMSNHYHMLVTTPNADIDVFMQAFNLRFSKLLREKSGRINRMFGGPYHWSIVDNRTYLYNVYRYVFQNPLRANLVQQCECYPYSSLYYEVNGSGFTIQLENHFESSMGQLLEWFNGPFSDAESDGIRRGLKHGRFVLNKDRNTKHLPDLREPSPS